MYRLKMNGAEPAVDQGMIHGLRVTWNPDDGRFYVEGPDGVHTFDLWRNAVQYCRRHCPD